MRTDAIGSKLIVFCFLKVVVIIRVDYSRLKSYRFSTWIGDFILSRTTEKFKGVCFFSERHHANNLCVYCGEVRPCVARHDVQYSE